MAYYPSFYPSLPTLIVHVVFSTKNQEPLIAPEIADFLYSYLEGLIEKEEGLLIEAGGAADHIHLLTSFSPERSIEYMVQAIKSASAGWINTRLEPEVPFAWQESYAVVSVSQPAALELRDYIRRQAEVHRHKSFKEEFIELLEEHEIEYDEKDLWD